MGFYIRCSRHIGLVLKGLPRHAFSKKSLFWGKTASKKRFLDVLHRKEAKISILHSDQIGFLPKRLAHAFSKNLKFLDCLFLGTVYMHKSPRENVS